jgi:hypothetical protein
MRDLTHYLAFVAFLLAIQGCIYTSHTTKLDVPIIRVPPEVEYRSSLKDAPGDEISVSIGEDLFRIDRYGTGFKEYVGAIAPTGRKFPDDTAGWKGTHVYNDGASGDLIVFTTPRYYNSGIGIILDSEERTATNAPVVQLTGSKKGRRWKMAEGREFFAVTTELYANWGMRYGGLKDNNYIFELYNKNDANVIEIIQSIQVTEGEFIAGFTVRDVFVQGLRKDDQGVITFSRRDIR